MPFYFLILLERTQSAVSHGPLRPGTHVQTGSNASSDRVVVSEGIPESLGSRPLFSPHPEAMPFWSRRGRLAGCSSMLSGVWPGQVVWKSLWGNSHHERDGKNPLLLISRGLIPRLHFALSSKIPPKPRCGGRRERVRFRQHLPRLRRSPSTSYLPHRLYGRMLRLGAGRPRRMQSSTRRSPSSVLCCSYRGSS
jgi:hypothetical protein